MVQSLMEIPDLGISVWRVLLVGFGREADSDSEALISWRCQRIQCVSMEEYCSILVVLCVSCVLYRASEESMHALFSVGAMIIEHEAIDFAGVMEFWCLQIQWLRMLVLLCNACVPVNDKINIASSRPRQRALASRVPSLNGRHEGKDFLVKQFLQLVF